MYDDDIGTPTTLRVITILCICVGVVFSTRPEDSCIPLMEANIAKFYKVIYVFLTMLINSHL